MSVVNITGPTLFEHQKAVVRKLDSMQPGETQSENKKNNVNNQYSSTKDLSTSSGLNPLF